MHYWSCVLLKKSNWYLSLKYIFLSTTPIQVKNKVFILLNTYEQKFIETMAK